jgi:hypothetical protein
LRQGLWGEKDHGNLEITSIVPRSNASSNNLVWLWEHIRARGLGGACKRSIASVFARYGFVRPCRPGKRSTIVTSPNNQQLRQ